MSCNKNFSLCFDTASQVEFANAVCDRNPIHISPNKARKSFIGQPIVHGIHLVLRSIDGCLVAFSKNEMPSALKNGKFTVRCTFHHPVYLDEEVSVWVDFEEKAKTYISCFVDELLVCKITISEITNVATSNFRSSAKLLTPSSNSVPLKNEASDITKLKPVEFSLENIDSGWLEKNFANIQRVIGLEGLKKFAALSPIVGMFYPGEHSLFLHFFASFDVAKLSSNRLFLKKKSFNQDFRFLRAVIQSKGYYAEYDSALRPKSVEPPDLAYLKNVIGDTQFPDFSGQKVLVVGASRGLGALFCRLLLLTGAEVTGTYAVCDDELVKVREECRRVAIDLKKFKTFSLDITKDQRPISKTRFDQLYYFASPQIFVRRTKFFDIELLHKFNEFYIKGFLNSCNEFLKTNGSSFYPSTIAIDEDDNSNLEYVQSKICGERLVHSLSLKFPLQTHTLKRLPRLLTDQTAQITPAQTQSSFDVAVEIMKEIEKIRVSK